MSDEVGCRVGHVDRVKESCGVHTGGNRVAAPTKGDTVHKSLQDKKTFVIIIFSKDWEL